MGRACYPLLSPARVTSHIVIDAMTIFAVRLDASIGANQALHCIRYDRWLD